MTSAKVLLESWRRYEQELNESRLYAMSPSELKDSEFNKAAGSQFVDKTNASDEETIRDILDAVANNDTVAISFVMQYQDEAGNDVVPSLGVSPHISYNTPHGIYTYPLNQENVSIFLYTGRPTAATFATDYDYFHLIKMFNYKTIKINRDRTTNYVNRRYKSDCRELVRVFLNYILAYMSENRGDALDIKENLLLDVDRKTLSVSLEYSEVVSNLYLDIYDYFENRYDETKSVDNSLINYVANFLDELSLTESNQFSQSAKKDRFNSIYFIAHFCSQFLYNVVEESGGYEEDLPNKSGGLFTIFLSAIGISNITDFEGSGTIHFNEPSQAVFMDTSDSSNFELLGTYTNRRFDSNLVESILDEYYEKGLLNTSISYKKDHKGDDNSVDAIIEKINNNKPNLEIDKKIIDIFTLINTNNNFNNVVYSECVSIFSDIHESLKTYYDDALTKYHDSLIKAGATHEEIESVFNYTKILHSFFYRISWNIGGVILSKETIKKSLERQSFLTSDLAKVNFVKFLNYMNDLITPMKSDEKQLSSYRNNFIKYTIDAFGGKAKLKKIEKHLNTTSIKEVYKDIF